MKNIAFAILWLSSLAHALELYYVSEDSDFLENKVIVHNDGADYKLSARPYFGFVIQNAIKVRNDGKFSVQLSGRLLEKDWPILSLAAKLGKSWSLEIEKGEVADGRAVLILHGLNEKAANSLVAQFSK